MTDYFWDENVQRISREQAEKRISFVRGDLNSLLDFVTPRTLRNRWRAMKLTAAELRTARRRFARDYHPALTSNPIACKEANRRVALANAAIDGALEDLKEKADV